MKIKELVKQWQANASTPNTEHEMCIRLPVYDAAKIAALADMFPGRTQEQIITDLLATALDELSASFEYRKGETILEHDDKGDPIYEDIGLTPRFHALTDQFARELLQQKEPS
ncbi:MAG: type 1 pili tip component [Nevskiales bacterium]